MIIPNKFPTLLPSDQYLHAPCGWGGGKFIDMTPENFKKCQNDLKCLEHREEKQKTKGGKAGARESQSKDIVMK